MGWIRDRIKDEKRKHHNIPFGQKKKDLDWARLAESKIIIQIMEDFVWKNNTVPMRDMIDNLMCECGHSLLEHKDMDLENKTGGGCKSDMCSCPIYKKKEVNFKLRLAATNGGYVNAMKLHDFLRGLKNER